MPEKVCVIIPLKGVMEKFNKCIDSVMNLDYPDLEIVVVDDGIGESTLTLLDKFKGKIKVLQSNSCGPSFARNLASRSTDAGLIAFTDSDCIVDKDWVSELAKALEKDPQAAGCGGKQDIPDDATGFEKKVFLFMKMAGFISDYVRKSKDTDTIEVNHNPSCNLMYKREIFLEEGGFLEGLWPGEDVELDFRLRKKGYKLLFNPRAVVYHYKPKNFKSFLKMMYRYGLAQGFLARKYGVFRRTQMIPGLNLFFLLVFLFFISYDKALALWFVSGILILAFLYFLDFPVLVIALGANLFWNLGFIRGWIRKPG